MGQLSVCWLRLKRRYLNNGVTVGLYYFISGRSRQYSSFCMGCVTGNSPTGSEGCSDPVGDTKFHVII